MTDDKPTSREMEEMIRQLAEQDRIIEDKDAQ